MSSPFCLSIESEHGKSRQHGFHLGTQEPLARKIAQEMFHARVKNAMPIVTVALMIDGKLYDTYYGDKWHSELICD